MGKVINREAESDVQAETMSEESLTFLEQVRKGKPRNFVMSMKGAKVRSLLVKKKRIKEAEKKEARGRGYQPLFGVVSGQGAKISFQIARSDGFDSDPSGGKTEKLKKFLKEQTGKAFKPTVELVDTPPPIPFDEEELADPLIAKFMKLEPVIAKVRDEHLDRLGETEARAGEIRGLLEDEETRASAGPKIDAFVQFLKKLLAGSKPGPSTASELHPDDSSAERAKTDEAVRQKLHLALAKLTPSIKQAAQSEPERRQEILEAVTAVKRPLDQGQLIEAKQALIALSALLKGLAVPGEKVDSEAEYHRLHQSLEPDYLRAVEGLLGDTGKMRAVMGYATEHAAQGDYEKAVTALRRLGPIVQEALAESLAGETEVTPQREVVSEYPEEEVPPPEVRASIDDVMNALDEAFDRLVTQDADPNVRAHLLRNQWITAVGDALRKLDAMSLSVDDDPLTELHPEGDQVPSALGRLRSFVESTAAPVEKALAQEPLDAGPALEAVAKARAALKERLELALLEKTDLGGPELQTRPLAVLDRIEQALGR